jgi:hypothetical protein
MANSILTGEPLLRNDLIKIAQIFDESFEFYKNHHTSFFPEFLQSLRTVAGLGFAASLADRGLFSVYQTYFDQFLVHEDNHFKVNPGTKGSLGRLVAELIHLATLCFYSLNFPPYYDEFIAALRCILEVAGLDGEKAGQRIIARLVVP